MPSCSSEKTQESFHGDPRAFVALLKSCAKLKDVQTGNQLWNLCVKQGLSKDHVSVCTAFVLMYAKCGVVEKAEEVLSAYQSRDVVAWNALIAGYVHLDKCLKALTCFERLQLQGITPDAATFSCILRVCGSLTSLEKGRAIHATVIKDEALNRNLFVGNSLLDMYAKCGAVVEAQEVFDTLQARNVVSWTSLISAYAQKGCGKEALDCFDRMRSQGIPPDAVAIVCSLKACACIVAREKGEEIHSYAQSKGYLQRNILVGIALVDMYAKCGALGKARKVFHKLSDANVAAWNALIAGYTQHEYGEEAMDCLERMKLQGIFPDVATFSCSLRAFAGSGATKKGREMHAMMEQEGLLQTSQQAGNALIDMYAKGGMLPIAQVVFDKLPSRNIVSWNALITGYAKHGKTSHVLCMFDRMKGEGVAATSVTFLCVLTACSHAGLVDKGQTYFQAISDEHGMIPSLEHCSCMVDLLSRAGQIDSAIALMNKAHLHNNVAMWVTVMGACRKWVNVELARLAFESALQLHGEKGAIYTCMFNIYADAGLQADVKKVDALRVCNRAWS